MIAIHNRQATHPWTGESGYHSLDLTGDSESQLKAIVFRLQKLGFTVWIHGHTSDQVRRPAAYLFHKVGKEATKPQTQSATFNPVISLPFTTLPDGTRVLQCHGDRRFTPFNCFVEAFGRRDTIENHYHRAKIFEGEIIPNDWREAKSLKKNNYKQIAWQIGPLRLPCQSNARGTSFAITDPGIQFYIALWFKYLRANSHLLEIAATFDEFEDPFRGDFPFCQADVIRQCVRHGSQSLLPMCSELTRQLRAFSCPLQSIQFNTGHEQTFPT